MTAPSTVETHRAESGGIETDSDHAAFKCHSLSIAILPREIEVGDATRVASLDYWEPARLPVNSRLKRSFPAVPFIDSPVTVAL